MMRKFLTATIAWLLITMNGGQASIAAEETLAAPALPTEVHAILPSGATSFLCQSLQLGPDDSSILIHIWGVVRPKGTLSLNSYDRYLESPFCIDVFQPSMKQDQTTTWQWIGSTSYSAANPPLSVLMHWLQPKVKLGPILEVVASNGAPGISTSHTLFVWSSGFKESLPSPSPQQFWSGGMGGGTLTLDLNGVDERGYLAIRSTDSYVGKVRFTKDYHWNGERFIHVQGAVR